MQTFSCFLFTQQSPVPDLMFITAASVMSARRLAKREFLAAKAVAVELCDGDDVLWTAAAKPISEAHV